MVICVPPLTLVSGASKIAEYGDLTMSEDTIGASLKASTSSAFMLKMSLPGFALSFTPTKIEVAKSGDIAYDVGTFELKTTDPQGKLVSEAGKYVVVWKKQNGQWKAVADIFNSDN